MMIPHKVPNQNSHSSEYDIGWLIGNQSGKGHTASNYDRNDDQKYGKNGRKDFECFCQFGWMQDEYTPQHIKQKVTNTADNDLIVVYKREKSRNFLLNRFKNIFLFEKLYDKMEKEIEEKKIPSILKEVFFDASNQAG